MQDLLKNTCILKLLAYHGAGVVHRVSSIARLLEERLEERFVSRGSHAIC